MGDCAGDVGAFDDGLVEPEGDFKVFGVHCCTDVFDEDVATKQQMLEEFDVGHEGGVRIGDRDCG